MYYVRLCSHDDRVCIVYDHPSMIVPMEDKEKSPVLILRTDDFFLASPLILSNYQCNNQYSYAVKYLHQISGGDGRVCFRAEIAECIFYIDVPISRQESAKSCYGVGQEFSGNEDAAEETGTKSEYIGEHI